jgi:DNA-binding beta-propeller fold protein YncE
MFLGAIVLPPGTYSQIRFSITRVQIGDATGTWKDMNGVPATVELSLGERFNLAADDSAALFVSWDVQKSLTPGGGFEPILQASAAIRQLPMDLLYVSCPDIDTIFVVRADTNHVVDAFGITGGPTWITAVQTGGDGFLYVLAARDRLVKVVDLSTYRTVDFFPAPLNDAPTFMQLDAENRVAFLLDEKSGYVSRMNLRSGYIEARTYLGFQPHFATYIEEKNLLAVSLALSQKVLLLDADTLENRGELSTGGRPQGLLFVDDLLYVAEQGDDTVAIFDLNSRRNLGRIVVSPGPMRIVDTGNQIYVSHRLATGVAALTPGQLSVFREIANLGRTTEMAYDPTFRRLYVVDEQSGGLAVIDVSANLLIGRVFFGARPDGLAVLP